MKKIILLVGIVSLGLAGCFLLPRSENHYDFLVDREFIEDDFEITDGDFSGLYPWERSGDISIHNDDEVDEYGDSSENHSFSGSKCVKFNSDDSKLSLDINVDENSFISFYIYNSYGLNFLLDKIPYSISQSSHSNYHFHSLSKGIHSIAWVNENYSTNYLDLIRIGQYPIFQSIDFELDEENILEKAYTFFTSDTVYINSLYAVPGGTQSLCLEATKKVADLMLIFKTNSSASLSFYYLKQEYGDFNCYLDGNNVASIWASNSNWTQYTIPNIAAGEHNIYFRFYNYTSYSDERENLYIDKIELTP